ncbi:MAG: DNA cytosine methyltransferase [Candidatus Faecousia sp.]|nr:DNA cytosine methyltransferase [Candidatus Faecousia sp.]
MPIPVAAAANKNAQSSPRRAAFFKNPICVTAASFFLSSWAIIVRFSRESKEKNCSDQGEAGREAARIQSFSDDFHFLGSRSDQAGQIGNAVPPYFMEQLADQIIEALQGKEIFLFKKQ